MSSSDDLPPVSEDDGYCCCAIGLAMRINDFNDERTITPPPLECTLCDSTGYKNKDQDE